jgi:hypothetical protein
MDIDGTELDAAAARFIWLAREGLPGDELDEEASWIRRADPAAPGQVYFSGADALAQVVPSPRASQPGRIRAAVHLG